MKSALRTSQLYIRRVLLPLIGVGTAAVLWESKKDWDKYNDPEYMPAVAKHSASIKEFITEVKAQGEGRYAPLQEDFVWTTSDPRLRSIMDVHFKDLVETLAIPSQTAKTAKPANVPVNVTNDNTLANSPDYQEMPSAVNVSAGGISALWAAYIQSVLYKQGAFPSDAAPPVYILPPDMKQSAYYGSSAQYHVSHATPMYTDPEFSTANILFVSLKRNLFPTKYNHPEQDNYMIGEIHPSAFLNPKVLSVGLGYLLHEMKYKFQSRFSKMDVTDETIPLAVTSGKVLDDISTELGSTLLLRKDTIRVAYNQAETNEMLALRAVLKKYGVECTELTFHQAEELSGTIPKIWKGGSIWKIEGDGNMVPNVVDILTEGIVKNGGKVIEGRVRDIVYDEEKRQISGVVIKGKDDTTTFIKSNRLYTSFGAKAEYNSQGTIKNIEPVEPIISGTGYSAYLLVEGSIKKPIDSNNSHFTPLKTVELQDGKKVTLVKTTCGGAIGIGDFCVDHAVNNMHYATQIIFPDMKVEIVAVRSCSRPLNGKNSGKIQEVLPGFYVGEGFGGKGVTDAAGFAVERVTENLARQADQQQVKSFVAKYATPLNDARVKQHH